MTHLNQNETHQTYQDTYGFLEQISITDNKKQKTFFSRHKLNFKNHHLLHTKSKRENNVSKGLFAIGLAIIAGVLFMAYHNVNKSNIIMEIDKIDANSSNYAPIVGRDYSMNNKMAQQKIVLELQHLIANPIADSKGHLYVDNTLIASLLQEFYLISDSNKHLDFQEYLNLLDDMDSPFIDDHLKKEFAYKGMVAMKENYKTASLSRDYYLSHFPKWDFSSKENTQAYQDEFNEYYFNYHESFFKFFAQNVTGVEYTLKQGDAEEQAFWNVIKGIN